MKKHDDLMNFLMQKVFSYITKRDCLCQIVVVFVFLVKNFNFQLQPFLGISAARKPKNWNLGIGFNIKAFLS